MKNKKLGQVFTPSFVVDTMLKNLDFLGKTILEPSFGKGAFLSECVRLYAQSFLKKSNNLKQLKKELEQNIIGVKIDENLFEQCEQNLNQVAEEFNLKNVQWNLICGDFLKVYPQFKNKIDYVIGNPPYVRIHYLNKNLKQFSKGGMTNLFLIFFDCGFKCLKEKGELIFITPSSWLKSKAGLYLRKNIFYFKNLKKLIDFSFEQVFENITTYSLISYFKKGVIFNEILLEDFQNPQNNRMIQYQDLFLPNCDIFLGNLQFKRIFNFKPLPVKNGFATNCDSFFFGDFKNQNYPTIPIFKASNGKWLDGIYPYDEQGNFKQPTGEVLKRYAQFELILKKRDLQNQPWQAFARTQGLKDTFFRKIAFNHLIKEIKDLRIVEVQSGAGVFGGYYLKTNLPLEFFNKVLKNKEFLEYVKSLGKYKNGGYYTFSSSDLGRFLAYKLSEENKLNECTLY